MKSLNALSRWFLASFRLALGLIFFLARLSKAAHSGAGMQDFFVQHGLPGYSFTCGVLEVLAACSRPGLFYAGGGAPPGH